MFWQQVVISGIVATIYKVWHERNNALWNMHVQLVNISVNEIKYSVDERIKFRVYKNMKTVDIQWLENL